MSRTVFFPYFKCDFSLLQSHSLHFDIFCGDLKQIRLRQGKFHREGYFSFPGRVIPVTATHITPQLIMINEAPPEVRHIILRDGLTEIVNPRP